MQKGKGQFYFFLGLAACFALLAGTQVACEFQVTVELRRVSPAAIPLLWAENLALLSPFPASPRQNKDHSPPLSYSGGVLFLVLCSLGITSNPMGLSIWLWVWTCLRYFLHAVSPTWEPGLTALPHTLPCSLCQGYHLTSFQVSGSRPGQVGAPGVYYFQHDCSCLCFYCPPLPQFEMTFSVLMSE